MRALISVYDKTGVVDLARGLVDRGWEIVSSGGTARALTEAGMPVTEVEDLTGSPEMLDGRVKTLHPAVHGGILADRSKPEHMERLAELGIGTIDMVVGNLYPFGTDPSVEMIDIGGPTMVRAAAKNHDSVAVVVDPARYPEVLALLDESGDIPFAVRRRLAREAFAHTAAYDAAIVAWLDDVSGEGDLPESLHPSLEKAEDLRYGENPHQVGARYRDIHSRSWWDRSVQHGGRRLSYLNVFDTEAAWQLVNSMGPDPTVAVIKHANPCGVAADTDITEAYRAAHSCDPVSAFGGIVAVNRVVPLSLAEALAPVFTEVIIAPGYEDDALAALTSRKNLRVLEGPPPFGNRLHLRSIDGGMLVQTADRVAMDRSGWEVATARRPTPGEWADLEFAWLVCAAVSSNAIVLVKDRRAVGIGAGQQSRVDSSAIATRKAAGRAVGGAAAGDAFFPFRDGLDAVAESGVTAVIQPGGSIRDSEVVAAADEHGIAMVFTGERHFRH